MKITSSHLLCFDWMVTLHGPFYYVFTCLPSSYFCVPGNISCRGAVKYHSSIESFCFSLYNLHIYITVGILRENLGFHRAFITPSVNCRILSF